MIREKSKVANAVSGRTARACDSCLRRRARWFCAADDAFLCQACDASVHGANQLAGRHQRVLLQSSSFKGKTCNNEEEEDEDPSPVWHRGFTRKARTPRRHSHRHQQAKQGQGDVDMALESFLVDPPLPFVPEICSEEEEEDRSPFRDRNDEERLLCQVPVFDAFAANGKSELEKLGQEPVESNDEFDHQIIGFLDSELDLAEFAADVESLLGVGGTEEDRSYRLDDVLGCKEEEEEEEEEDFDVGIDIDVDLDQVCASLEPRVKVEEDDQSSALGFQKNPNPTITDDRGDSIDRKLWPETPSKSDILLTLNYEAVIAAWDSQGSPWLTGIRPNVKPGHGWPDCMDMWPLDHFGHTNGEWRFGHIGSAQSGGSGGREARVSRYREKRRTRLFSKKIRYEVRKLNAEKRPRMKGRFVKRTSFMGPNNNNPTMIGGTTFPYHFINK